MTNTGSTTLTDVVVGDSLPNFVMDERVLETFVAYHQPPLIPAAGNLGPFASVDRELSSDPFEAKAWDNFTLAQQTVVDAIDWTGAYVEPFANSGFVPETDFLVEIFADGGGQPGATLHAFDLAGGLAGVDDAVVRTTRLGHSTLLGGPVFEYHAMLPFTVLQPGAYWISITALQTFPSPAPQIDPSWLWHLGGPHPGDGFFSYDDTFDDPGDNDRGDNDEVPRPKDAIDGKDLAFTLHASRLVDFDGTLRRGETRMFMGTYVVTQQDIDAGQIVNTGTVTAIDSSGKQITDADGETWSINQYPSLQLEIFNNGEDADVGSEPAIDVGQPVTWTFEVRNTGNVTLLNVMVTDDRGLVPMLDASTDVNGDGLLSPGETWQFFALDVAVAGQYETTGTASARPPSGSAVSATDVSQYLGVTRGDGACVPNPGDIDGDGLVGFRDFLTLSRNFGNTDATLASGDLNCDGVVSFSDFLIFSRNYGEPVLPNPSPAAVDQIFANREVI